MNNDLFVLPSECDFLTAQSNTGKRSPCSPQLTPKFSNPFQGILINAPKQVVWDKNLTSETFMVSPHGESYGPLRLMLSGLLKVPYNYLGIEDDYIYQLTVIAVNKETEKVYSGKMNRRGIPAPKVPIEMLNTSEESNKSNYGDCKEHFNIDLIQNLTVPIESANYVVYVVLGDYKSNVREISVIVE